MFLRRRPVTSIHPYRPVLLDDVFDGEGGKGIHIN